MVSLRYQKRRVQTKVILLAVLFAGCAGGPVTTITEMPPEAHEQLNSVLWVRTAPEYEAICREIFAQAALSLDEALADRTRTASLEQSADYEGLPPAVILDVDETALDNSAFEARLIVEGKEYNQRMWDAWIAEEEAPAVPGAQDFIRLALERGVEVFFVTNRDHDTEEHTLRNLRKRFGPAITGDRVLTRKEQADWTSDKTSRRAYVAATHRVLLLVGDDLNDFVYPGETTPQARRDNALQYSKYWGTGWIIVPNPMYGSWEQALYGFDRGLERNDRLNLKRGALGPPE